MTNFAQKKPIPRYCMQLWHFNGNELPENTLAQLSMADSNAGQIEKNLLLLLQRHPLTAQKWPTARLLHSQTYARKTTLSTLVIKFLHSDDFL